MQTEPKTEPIPMMMPKRAADFVALGVKCWNAALVVLEPYANAQPHGSARRVLLNDVRVLREMVERAERMVITGAETPRKPPTPLRGLDRRGRTRPPQPACPVCNAPPEDMQVTIRTGPLVYFKCNRCGEPLTIDLPHPKPKKR